MVEGASDSSVRCVAAGAPPTILRTLRALGWSPLPAIAGRDAGRRPTRLARGEGKVEYRIRRTRASRVRSPCCAARPWRFRAASTTICRCETMGRKRSPNIAAKAIARVEAVAKASYQRKRTTTEIIPPDVSRAKAGAWLTLLSPITEWAGLKGDALNFQWRLLRIQQEDTLLRVAQLVRDELSAVTGVRDRCVERSWCPL